MEEERKKGEKWKSSDGDDKLFQYDYVRDRFVTLIDTV